MMKDDQRVALTKRLLQEGLFRLLKEKDISKISVTELCTQAGINRATFYRHYEQPRDILTELRRQMFQDVKIFAEQDDSEDSQLKYLEETCQYFYENAGMMRILIRCRTDDEIVELLNDLYQEQFPVLRSKGYGKELDDDSLRLATYYFAGGIYYILRQWLVEPIHKTPKEVASLIHRFLTVH